MKYKLENTVHFTLYGRKYHFKIKYVNLTIYITIEKITTYVKSIKKLQLLVVPDFF